MLYILLVAIASTVIANALFYRKMKVALVVYCLAYFFIATWSALILGFYWASNGVSLTISQLLGNTLFEALENLSIFQQSTLILLTASSIWLAAVCLAGAFLGGQAIAQKAQKKVVLNTHLTRNDNLINTTKVEKHCYKIYLRLCRFNS